MDYKTEPLETNFGKGVRIEKGKRSYEQFSCRDSLFARVYQAPSEEKGQLINTDYHGVIHTREAGDVSALKGLALVLAERIENQEFVFEFMRG